ncbi:MAG: BrnT family toxin [Planctomycetes bacterium]|nr:BrnT family toxin [Planctomycetota bacterium]
MGLEFDWDPRKSESNLRKHRVTFEEAMEVFKDPLSLTIPDVDDEERWITIGRSLKDRILVVVFTEATDTIRIISARRATKHEQNAYEEK